MPVCFSANAIYSLEESRDGLRDLLKQLRTTNASMRAELEELERVTASLNALPSLANVASLVQLADGDKYALDSITAASHTAEAVPTTSSSSGSEGADVPASTSPEPASV